MLKEQRVEIILDELSRNGIISIDNLAKRIDVSHSTIRRDIEDLEAQSTLRRIRGGAVACKPTTSFEPPFSARKDMFYEEKRRIAKAAHSLIGANETLLLSGGTTVHEFSITLHDSSQLYIATNDLMSAVELSHFNNVDLMVLGGSLRKQHFSLNGYFTESMISQIHADKAFIGIDAVDFETGFMNFSIDEISSSKLMIKASREVIVLCDHSKFNKVAFVNICKFEDVDLLITDDGIDERSLKRLRELDVNVMTV
jgi:DeoR/GlpR family transcriptional regulator of sugar metabolism